MSKFYRTNEKIRSRQVRVILDNQNLGVVPKEEALRLARSKEMDLVEVVEGDYNKPSVCRIVDYGKFVFEEKKREKAAKKNSAAIDTKEIQFTPLTDEADLRVKIKKIEEFLQEGKQVKVFVRFRGRQIAHVEEGNKIVDRVIKETAEIGKVQSRSKLEGKNLFVLLMPK